MKKLHILAIVLIVLFAALPVMAQDSDSAELAAALPVPAVLLGLIAANQRLTDTVKKYLVAENLPFTPSASTRSFIVLVASMLIGLVSAAVTPNALDWLGEGFNPYAGVFVTGIAVSFGGGALQMLLSIVDSLRRVQPASTSGTSATISFTPTVMPTEKKDLVANG